MEHIIKNIWNLFKDHITTETIIHSIFMENQLDDKLSTEEIKMNKTQLLS